MDFSVFLTPDAWIALLTLTLLEVVLGIDNIIFVSIAAGRLPEAQQNRARVVGLALALLMRVAMLLGISWMVEFEAPLFTALDFEVSVRDLLLGLGGLFLLAKSTSEIHQKTEGQRTDEDSSETTASFGSVILQILLLDAIFSLDSILTAVGMTSEIVLMITAVVISMVIMIRSAETISDFIHQHPSLQVLALSFLLLIGFMLVLEAVHIEVPKGYIYFALFFSLGVELLNMRVRRKKNAVNTKPKEAHSGQ